MRPSIRIPILAITRSEAALPANAPATTRRRPRSSKQILSISAAASVAYPCPTYAGSISHPIAAWLSSARSRTSTCEYGVSTPRKRSPMSVSPSSITSVDARRSGVP